MTSSRSGAHASTGEKHSLDDASAPDQASKTQKTGDDGMKQTTLYDSFTPSDETKPSNNSNDDNNKKQDAPTVYTKQDMTMNEDEDKGTHDVMKDPEPTESTTGTSSKDETESAIEPNARNGSTPSNILEKGIIYFFFRGRVGIDDPSDVSDIARSYFILRPIPKDAKLGDGPIGDASNSRLCALPKKVLPQSGKDRWISFVEKSGASFDTLKEFLASNDYETKTAGTRHSPAATPIGEGIYAITTTGRVSHLAYILTLPNKLGEVQEEMGLKQKGSFVISTRNPQYEAPKNTQLPQGPEYPKEVLDEFRSLRWMGTVPKHLDYPNTQFLLVGESSGIDKAMQPDKKDEKAGDKEEPIEEMERLEEEDTERMKDLGKDDSAAIFADLEIHAKDYPMLQTTF